MQIFLGLVYVGQLFSVKNVPPEAVAGQNDADRQNDRDDNGNHSKCPVRRLIRTCDEQQTHTFFSFQGNFKHFSSTQKLQNKTQTPKAS